MLTREEHAVLLASILEDPTAAEVSEKVTQLAENYAHVLAENTLAVEQVANLTKQNDDLIQQNMKLFLKVGVGDVIDEDPLETTEEPPLTYEALIKEDGHIF